MNMKGYRQIVGVNDEIEETGESRPNHYSQDPNSIECIDAVSYTHLRAHET